MSNDHKPRMLDEEAAFLAMCVYLEAYWERGLRSSSDIAVLLGNLQGDPAAPHDWAAAVEQVVG